MLDATPTMPHIICYRVGDEDDDKLLEMCSKVSAEAIPNTISLLAILEEWQYN
jgi:hypothetical protein